MTRVLTELLDHHYSIREMILRHFYRTMTTTHGLTMTVHLGGTPNSQVHPATKAQMLMRIPAVMLIQPTNPLRKRKSEPNHHSKNIRKRSGKYLGQSRNLLLRLSIY